MNDSNNNLSEVWMDVPGFPGYQVSNKGHLRRLKRKALIEGQPHEIFRIRQLNLMATRTTCRPGWFIYPDGDKFFLGRDDLLKLFVGIPVEADEAEENKIRDWRRIHALPKKCGNQLEPRPRPTTRRRDDP